MNAILKQYKNVEARILPILRGPLTYNNLTKMLNEMRNVTNVIVAEIPKKIQERIVSQGIAYIPPRDLYGTTLTAHLVIESLAVSVLIDEYLMSLTNLPKIKTKFWKNLKKDGLNFHIWSSIERSLSDRQ
jgi:hypothetical protein